MIIIYRSNENIYQMLHVIHNATTKNSTRAHTCQPSVHAARLTAVLAKHNMSLDDLVDTSLTPLKHLNGISSVNTHRGVTADIRSIPDVANMSTATVGSDEGGEFWVSHAKGSSLSLYDRDCCVSVTESSNATRGNQRGREHARPADGVAACCGDIATSDQQVLGKDADSRYDAAINIQPESHTCGDNDSYKPECPAMDSISELGGLMRGTDKLAFIPNNEVKRVGIPGTPFAPKTGEVEVIVSAPALTSDHAGSPALAATTGAQIAAHSKRTYAVDGAFAMDAPASLLGGRTSDSPEAHVSAVGNTSQVHRDKGAQEYVSLDTQPPATTPSVETGTGAHTLVRLGVETSRAEGRVQVAGLSPWVMTDSFVDTPRPGGCVGGIYTNNCPVENHVGAADGAGNIESTTKNDSDAAALLSDTTSHLSVAISSQRHTIREDHCDHRDSYIVGAHGASGANTGKSKRQGPTYVSNGVTTATGGVDPRSELTLRHETTLEGERTPRMAIDSRGRPPFGTTVDQVSLVVPSTQGASESYRETTTHIRDGGLNLGLHVKDNTTHSGTPRLLAEEAIRISSTHAVTSDVGTMITVDAYPEQSAQHRSGLGARPRTCTGSRAGSISYGVDGLGFEGDTGSGPIKESMDGISNQQQPGAKINSKNDSTACSPTTTCTGTRQTVGSERKRNDASPTADSDSERYKKMGGVNPDAGFISRASQPILTNGNLLVMHTRGDNSIQGSEEDVNIDVNAVIRENEEIRLLRGGIALDSTHIADVTESSFMMVPMGCAYDAQRALTHDVLVGNGRVSGLRKDTRQPARVATQQEGMDVLAGGSFRRASREHGEGNREQGELVTNMTAAKDAATASNCVTVDEPQRSANDPTQQKNGGKVLHGPMIEADRTLSDVQKGSGWARDPGAHYRNGTNDGGHIKDTLQACLCSATADGMLVQDYPDVARRRSDSSEAPWRLESSKTNQITGMADAHSVVLGLRLNTAKETRGKADENDTTTSDVCPPSLVVLETGLAIAGKQFNDLSFDKLGKRPTVGESAGSSDKQTMESRVYEEKAAKGRVAIMLALKIANADGTPFENALVEVRQALLDTEELRTTAMNAVAEGVTATGHIVDKVN